MTARAARSILASAITGGALLGCGGPRLPEPAREPPCLLAPCRAAHEGEVPITVPYPPPPAKVDVIGDPPPDVADPVWVDGQWIWRGRAWAWEPGTWLPRPPSQYYAAPAIVRLSDGQLVWFEGSFRPYGRTQKPAPAGGLPSSGPPSEKPLSP